MDTGAVLVAAGSGSRAGSLKQFEMLAGRPLFTWALRALADCKRVAEIVVVVPPGCTERAASLSAGLSGRFVAGGERRQDSVRLGLQALPPCEWVVVQDAARPFLTSELVERSLQAAAKTGAAAVGTPLSDALKRADPDLMVTETIPRDSLWAVQTPQAFKAKLILRAHQEVKDDVPDDAAMVEQMGAQVMLFEGPRGNIKITTAEDFALAEAMLKGRESD
jgi:2-C-methyl-D-erythritol 4-phosphate cytidylyltransferase